MHEASGVCVSRALIKNACRGHMAYCHIIMELTKMNIDEYYLYEHKVTKGFFCYKPNNLRFSNTCSLAFQEDKISEFGILAIQNSSCFSFHNSNSLMYLKKLMTGLKNSNLYGQCEGKCKMR